MLEDSIKFQPRRDNQGDSKSVDSPKSNYSPPAKPFKDLLEKESGESDRRLLTKSKEALESGEDPTLVEDILASAEQSPASIYDLSKKPAVKDPIPFRMKQPEPEVLNDTPPPSPDQLFRTISKHDTKQAPADPTTNEHANLEGKIHTSDIQRTMTGKENPKIVDEEAVAAFYQPTNEKKSDKTPVSFSKEQTDLSYINPLATQQTGSNNVGNFETQKATLPAQSIQQIVDQIVKEMEVRELQGKTETTITLNHPTIFKGAEVIVTSFDTAKGQFNITFQNLGPQAKMLLDAQATQDSLKHALEVKGYMVHIITATTEIERPVIATNADNQSRGTREEQQREQQEKEEEQG